MSKLLTAAQCSGAMRRPVWSKPDEAPHFAAWSADASAAANMADCGVAVAEEIIDFDAVKADAFAQGFDEGQRVLLEAVAQERAALAALAGALETLTPEPTAALAAMLAETVDRLVRQIVGEVTLDRDTLLARCAGAAALIGDDMKPATLRLNPMDAERLDGAVLPVAMVADESVAPGMVLLETTQGWIEDGPAVRLDRLRVALDAMAPPK